MALKKMTKPGTTALPPHKTAAPPETRTRPSKLRFEDARHMYFDGKKWLPSVTGIIKRIGEDQGGLMIHHSDITAKCAIEEAAEVSRLRRLEGDDAAWEYLRKAADRHKEKAGVKGSDLHDVVDRMQSGAEVPEYLHDDILAMAKQVIAFLRDYQVQVLYSEVRLAHRSMGYAGTCDVIGVVPQYGPMPMAIDWKTGKSMYEKPEYSHAKNATQLAPYTRAKTMFWDDKTEADMIEVNQDTGLIVMVRPEEMVDDALRPAGYKVYEYDLHRAWPQFERAFTSYWWWRDDAKTLARPVRPKVAAAPENLSDSYAADVARAAAKAELAETVQQVQQDVELEQDTREIEFEQPRQVAKTRLIARLRHAESETELEAIWEASQDVWDDDATRMVKARQVELQRALLDQIAAAEDVDTLDALWAAHESSWNDAYTAEVRKRIAQLEAAS